MWQLCKVIANKFGKEDSFGIGLFFLGVIFWLILGFGDDQYQGEKATNDEVLDA